MGEAKRRRDMFDGELPERLRGGNQVRIVRIDPTNVAIVFTMGSAEDADHLERNTLAGLKRGEFRMRLRGKVTSVEQDPETEAPR